MLETNLGFDNRCTVCGQPGDTLKHVFLDCTFSKAVWTLSIPGFITLWDGLWDDFEMWSLVLNWLQAEKLVETWMYIVWLL